MSAVLRRCWTCGDDRPVEAFRAPYGRRCEDCWERAREQAHCGYCGEYVGFQADGRTPRRLCGRPECVRQARANATRAVAECWRRRRKRRTRRCPACRQRKPLTIEFWSVRKRDPQTGEVVSWDGYCKSCKAADARARYAGDPGYRAAAIGRSARQRAEGRNNRGTGGRKRRMLEPDLVDCEAPGELPVAPLAEAVDRWLKREDAADCDVIERLGVSDRTLRAWRNGERKAVGFDVADRVLLGMDVCWWEVWSEDEWPAVARAWRGESLEAA